MAVTSAEILSQFGLGSAVKDSDQFLLGIAGQGGSLTLAKVAASIVKAYLRGNLTTTDITGTVDGEEATLEAILNSIRENLTSMVDRTAFNQMSAIVSDLVEHTGIIHFSGYADGIEIVAQTSYSESMITGYFYDRVNKTFIAHLDEEVEWVGGRTEYCNWSPSMSQYIKQVGVLWPMKVYHCDADGMNYMWDGTDLIQLNGQGFADHEETAAVEIEPGILHRWEEINSLSVQLIGSDTKQNFWRIFLHAEVPEVECEYRLQFTVDSAAFQLDIDPSVRWMNDEEPDWELGWTYQVSIEDGLAIAAGWPAENE